MTLMSVRAPLPPEPRRRTPGEPQTPTSRDAGLRRLALCRRWLLAGTATLTGALAAVAANAFPGKAVKTTTGTAAQAGAASSAAGRSGEGSSASQEPGLQAPEGQPQASPESSTGSTPGQEGAASEPGSAGRPSESAGTPGNAGRLGRLLMTLLSLPLGASYATALARARP